MESLSIFLLAVILVLVIPFSDTFQPDEQTCGDCHGAIINREVIHKAMNAGCDLCHQPTGEDHPLNNAKGFSLTEEMPELCYLCHEDYREMKYLHEPLGNCLTCHTPHNSDEKKLLINESSSLCKSCHEDVLEIAENSPFSHQPAKGKGSCMDCHSPHSSMEKRLLLAEDRELCLTCHNREYITDSTSIRNMAQLFKNNKVEHKALNGGCSLCHLPHGSDYSNLLIDYYPSGEYAAATYENFSLCFICHDSDLMEADSTTTATNFRNGEQNLHYLHINGKKGRNCHLCHNIHAASQEYIIEESVNFGSWEMQMNFSIQENGGSCQPGCHGEKAYHRGGS